MNDTFTMWGQVVGTVTMIIAVAVFAIPTGILGNGLVEIFNRQKEGEETEGEDAEPEPEVCLRAAPPMPQQQPDQIRPFCSGEI